MPERYWLVHPNGGRQLIDPRLFDLDHLAEQARRVGGQLVGGGDARNGRVEAPAATAAPDFGRRFEPPTSALGPLFRTRLVRIYECKYYYYIDVNSRPTVRVLGG